MAYAFDPLLALASFLHDQRIVETRWNDVLDGIKKLSQERDDANQRAVKAEHELKSALLKISKLECALTGPRYPRRTSICGEFRSLNFVRTPLTVDSIPFRSTLDGQDAHVITNDREALLAIIESD